MTQATPPDVRHTLAAVIFDVDGVIVASPHEQAWRESLAGITDPARLTTSVYQTYVAGKPRMDGARAALAQLGIADAGGLAERYAESKQLRVEALIAQSFIRLSSSSSSGDGSRNRRLAASTASSVASSYSESSK